MYVLMGLISMPNRLIGPKYKSMGSEAVNAAKTSATGCERFSLSCADLDLNVMCLVNEGLPCKWKTDTGFLLVVHKS